MRHDETICRTKQSVYHSRGVFPEMQHRMETHVHSVCSRGQGSMSLRVRVRRGCECRSARRELFSSDPRENSFSRDLICACVSMPMTTCQPGHRLSCPILLVLTWLVLYCLQDVRNGEARNRSTMRALAKTARLSPVTVRLIPVPTAHNSWVYLAKNDSHTQ